jgi:hypothetical protein
MIGVFQELRRPVMRMIFKSKKKSVRSQGGDIYVSKTKQEDRWALCFRFSEEVLNRLRWRAGDRVFAELERDGSTDTWTMTRVPDDNTEGMKISPQGHGNGCIRRSCEKDEIDAVFTNCCSGYTGWLVEGDIKRATFAVDTSAKNVI